MVWFGLLQHEAKRIIYIAYIIGRCCFTSHKRNPYAAHMHMLPSIFSITPASQAQLKIFMLTLTTAPR
eukprot:COSAG02_NODE_9863_length_2088_cov_18.442433_2_plen_68_part_00